MNQFHKQAVRRVVVLVVLAIVLTYIFLEVPAARTHEPVVKVRIETGASREFLVRSESGNVLVRAPDGYPLHRFEDDSALHVSFADRKVRINGHDFDSVILQFDFDSSFGLDTGDSERIYSGRLHLLPGVQSSKSLVINETNIEDYVSGVIAVEMPFNELEALKAQAILARTYALRSKSRHAKFDVYDDTRSQMFLGISRATSVSKQAVAETDGIVVTYNDSLVEALYSSSNGGYSASNATIWDGTPLPYLNARPDSSDSISPHSEWSFTLEMSDLLQILTNAFGVAAKDIRVAEKSPDGRWKYFVLVGPDRSETRVLANSVRQVLANRFGEASLRSTLFEMRQLGDRVVFDGKGYGHGVGLSQWGAIGMARRGLKAQEILSFYFSGVEFSKEYGN